MAGLIKKPVGRPRKPAPVTVRIELLSDGAIVTPEIRDDFTGEVVKAKGARPGNGVPPSATELKERVASVKAREAALLLAHLADRIAKAKEPKPPFVRRHPKRGQ